jgi:thiol-disulfide isomerase/thioredoxin
MRLKINNMVNKISKIVISIIILLSGFYITFQNDVNAEVSEPINLYLFYGDGCPHCAKEKEFFKTLKTNYGNKINIHEYEVYNNYDNVELFNKAADFLKIDVGGVPFLIIGEKYFIGYGSDETTGKDISKEIDNCIKDRCLDSLSELLLGKDIVNITNIPEKVVEGEVDKDNTSPIYLNTFVFGNVDLKSVSLPLATILIALVDGFNPCAMWILIFLITMLINMEDKKRLYILGSVFILTSGIIYFFFLSAWFNFFKFIGYVYWIKVVIGIVAIVSGYLHIKNALFSKGGCHVTSDQQRESIMDKIKKIIKEKSFILSIFGIVTLAISVNLIEVVCSAGLPAIYTNLLSTIRLSTLEYYMYLLLYVFVFMLDDLTVFFIAVKTFEVTGIAKKYTKWSSLIGGIIILIIGIILIIKPELLMFG